jgi:carboxylate-amine ligase
MGSQMMGRAAASWRIGAGKDGNEMHGTVGVEEEYLVVDAVTGELCPRGGGLLEAARSDLGPKVQAEMSLAQIEVGSAVCTSLDEVAEELTGLRSVLGGAAAGHGVAIAATGTHPDASWAEQAITPQPRYLELEREYQQLAREQLVCGCHVHVGVDDPDDAVRAMDRVRPWVPTLLALSANSPFWQGADTGYASYRTQVFDRWPTAGPAPLCGDRAGYEQVVAELTDVGMIADASYLYWHVRPSHRYSTLELRVADVSLDVDGPVMLAGLFRSLVHAALTDGPGVDDPPGDEVLRAATWRASRSGLDGPLIDPIAREEVPAPELVRRLLAHVAPAAAELGDLPRLEELVGAVLRKGNGAQRQRRASRVATDLGAVTRMVVAATVGGGAERVAALPRGA